MSLPEACRYTKDHEWVKQEGADVIVGITDFAQSELGELVFVELPAIGKVVKKGEAVCVVESTKAASDVYSPVSGTVVAVNDELTSSPDKVNTDPYSSGWMVKLSGVAGSDLEALLSAAQYQALLDG